ncbi:MAG: hypothetical protein R3F59_34330 [Myxococcota bacterium]
MWGDTVRAAVEAFCRGEVQHSDHPFTAAEIAAFEAEAQRRFLAPAAAAEASP